jgi:hypothetical protein
VTRWYRELDLVRMGHELERGARTGEFSRWLCGQEALERLYGSIETLRADGYSLKLVAANLRRLGFSIAESTLAASLRAIRTRAAADLDRVFSELEVTELPTAAPEPDPPHPVFEQPAPLGASIDLDFDDWFRAAPL